MPFIQRTGVLGPPAPAPSLPPGVTVADLRAIERQVARRHGYNRPFVLGSDVGTCPGTAEYGHGLSLTTVHGGTCCERWDDLITQAVAGMAAVQAGEE